MFSRIWSLQSLSTIQAVLPLTLPVNEGIVCMKVEDEAHQPLLDGPSTVFTMIPFIWIEYADRIHRARIHFRVAVLGLATCCKGTTA